MPKVVVVGCGYWGKNLLRCFNSLGALAGFFDVSEASLESASKTYPDLKKYSSIDEILKDKDVDGVVVATNVEYHFNIAKRSLLAGKHIFVEKPVTVIPEEAEELCLIAEAEDKVFLVGHLLEYHPAVIKMREMISDGNIGEVKEIYSHRLSPGKIRQFENVWWSFAPHDILLILNTVGKDYEEISCVASAYLQKGIADSTITLMKFPNNCLGHIYVSWTHPYKTQRLVVTGTRGALEFDDRAKNKLTMYQHIEEDDGSYVINKSEMTVVAIGNEEPLLEECKDFLKCMETGGIPKSSGRDGLKVVKVLNEAMRNQI